MFYKNIMLAIDGSEASNAAVQEVLKLIKDQQVHLHVLHVVDESVFYAGGPSFDYLSLVAELREKGEVILDAAVHTIESKSSIKVEKSLLEPKLLQGRIAELIIEEAKDWPADILVLGTHGRRGFSRFFLGSVAEDIMRIATMPVLLVHAPQ
jgi:nucleotide-binding universal stress UspA family protein